MFERNELLYSLVEDGIVRLRNKNDPTGNRMILHYCRDLTKINVKINNWNFEGNVNVKEVEVNEVVSVPCYPDVVYLDPMYPEDFVGKKSKVKKETQILHRILGNEEGSDESNNVQLLVTAFAFAKKRVVSYSDSSNISIYLEL